MDLHEQASVLIVGAGPTGLAAALFLAHHGIRARIIDRSDAPSCTSRAQVINPRSLELLEPTGVSQAILAEARSIRGVKLNLGIEDAFVYADCAARALLRDGSEAITEYGRLRHPVYAAVVARMDKLTRLARGQPGWISLLRHYFFPAVTRFGPAARFLRDFIAGVDQRTRLRV